MNEKLNVKITINFDHAPLTLLSSVDQDHIQGDFLNKLYIQSIFSNITYPASTQRPGDIPEGPLKVLTSGTSREP